MADFSKLERPLSTLKLGFESAMKLWSRQSPSTPVRLPSESSSPSGPAPCETLSPSVLSSSPSIPPDLLFHIFQHLLWQSRLSPKARSDLLKAISLVDRTWHTIALRVSIRHIHLPGPISTYALLPSRTLLPTPDNRPLIYTCTSITFTSSPPRLQQVILPPHTIQSSWVTPPPTASSALSFIDLLPNLHHLSLTYPHKQPGYIPHVRNELFKIRFPPQLTHLSIDFLHEHRHLYWGAPPERRPTVPTVRHLSLFGLPSGYIADILLIFTHVDTLTIALTSNSKGVRTDTGLLFVPSLPSIPASVRTLVIRHPPSHMCRFRNGWVYSQFVAELALGGFRALHLVFRTSVALDDHDPQSFEGFQSYCERYGVLVEYEHDDQQFPTVNRLHERVRHTLPMTISA